MPADVDAPDVADTDALCARFPRLSPDVLAGTQGRTEAVAAELARAHDLTLSEAMVALSELPGTIDRANARQSA